MLLSEFGRLGDAFAEMRRMQAEMNRLFEGVVPSAYPPVNLWAGDNSVVVTAELPGVLPEDVDLTVRDDVLVLKGKCEPEQAGEDLAWHRRERPYGSFSRAIELPFRVDADRVQARFADGILEIELERPEQDRPRKIQVKAS
jgi:HSP20 family protein